MLPRMIIATHSTARQLPTRLVQTHTRCRSNCRACRHNIPRRYKLTAQTKEQCLDLNRRRFRSRLAQPTLSRLINTFPEIRRSVLLCPEHSECEFDWKLHVLIPDTIPTHGSNGSC